MFAIISKADGFPISCQVGNDAPALVVTWTSDASAKKFISAKGIAADYEVAPLTEDSLSRMAKAMGCEADSIEFDSYPD